MIVNSTIEPLIVCPNHTSLILFQDAMHRGMLSAPSGQRHSAPMSSLILVHLYIYYLYRFLCAMNLFVVVMSTSRRTVPSLRSTRNSKAQRPRLRMQEAL